MALPLARNRGDKGQRAPETEAIFAAMAVATTDEAAKYLVVKFEEKMHTLGPAMVEKSKAVTEKLQEYSDNVSLQRGTSTDIWSGRISPLTDFQNLQQNLAGKAAQEIGAKVKGNVKMDFAISDSSQLIRGFTEDGKAVSKDKVKHFDTLFNSWLAEPREGPENEKTTFISKGSTIYEGTEHGEIRRDKEGNPVKAEAEAVKKLINDKDEGFQPYMQDKLKDTGIQTSIQEHKYPEAKVEAEKPPVVSKAEEKVVSPKETPEPEGVSSPSSGART